jgi:hypothetical protein
MRNRAQEWLSYKNGISNELYYETTLHLDSAWNDQFDFGGNGDGNLWYPGRPDLIGGTHHVPVESMRMKYIREGIEDYEYLKMLTDLGDGAWAMQQVQALFPSAGATGAVNPDDLYKVREAIAARIDQHYPAPTSGGTVAAGGTTGSTGTNTGSGTTGSTGTTTGSSTDNGGASGVTQTPVCQGSECKGPVSGGCSTGEGFSLIALAVGSLALRRRK